MVTCARRAAATVVMGLLMLAAGCGRDVTEQGSANQPAVVPTLSTASTAGPSATGTWSGTWTRTAPIAGSGTMTFVLQQQGQSITGTIDVGGSSCLTKGAVTGSLNATTITLHAKTPAINGGGDATGDYDATLSGDTMTGKIKVTCSSGTGVGTFDLKRT